MELAAKIKFSKLAVRFKLHAIVPMLTIIVLELVLWDILNYTFKK